MAKQAPHVLQFQGERVVDGRKLPRPVNYGLFQITPPAGVAVHPKSRPFVVVCTARRPRTWHRRVQGRQRDRRRAGRGPPLLLRGLSARSRYRARRSRTSWPPRPRSSEDHRAAPRGRGQAGGGRQLPRRMGHDDGGRDPARAVRPDHRRRLALSYWAGVRGENPMRYTGGLLGGSWLTAFAGDLGNGTSTGRPRSRTSRTSTRRTRSGPSSTTSTPRSNGSPALPRLREVVGRPRAVKCRGDAVDRRQPVRRQQARHRRDRDP